MSTEFDRPIGSCLETLAQTVVNVLEWKWDSRFSSALAEIATERSGAIWDILQQHFPNAWDASNLSVASELVQAVGRTLGGLMSGQRLLVAPLGESSCVFCAWWPWGNGQTISLRIAPFDRDATDDEMDQLTLTLRKLFTI